MGESQAQPAGGFDDTPVPKHPDQRGWTVRFTFHSATNLPMADYGSFSSDPYLTATLTPTGISPRHKEDPPLVWRTSTKRRTTEPEWNESWTVANLPRAGFKLKLRLYDEDPGNHDDRLGNAHIHLTDLPDALSSDNAAQYEMMPVDVKKRSGSWRAYGLRYLAVGIKHRDMDARVIVSMALVGKTEGDSDRVYTVGPNVYSRHFSPLFGRVAGTKDTNKQGVEEFNFEANQIQLTGPVPDQLYHRYVEFKSFVKPMFSGKGIRGKALSHLLHVQHHRIYLYDKQTEYGTIDKGDDTSMALEFLNMVHFDQGARMFTYVLMIDGQMRFTETGKEFGIDLLSKHTMHSDVAQYIAYSGEFLVRRVKHPKEREKPLDKQEAHPLDPIEGGPPNSDPPQDVSLYELLIDNDSGTYRPKGDLLPVLQQFLEQNFKGLKVIARRSDDDAYQELKQKHRELKKKEGDKRIYAQRHGSSSSLSSLSSSDVSDLDRREPEAEEKGNMVERLTGQAKQVGSVLAHPIDGAMHAANNM